MANKLNRAEIIIVSICIVSCIMSYLTCQGACNEQDDYCKYVCVGTYRAPKGDCDDPCEGGLIYECHLNNDLGSSSTCSSSKSGSDNCVNDNYDFDEYFYTCVPVNPLLDPDHDGERCKVNDSPTHVSIHYCRAY